MSVTPIWRGPRPDSPQQWRFLQGCRAALAPLCRGNGAAYISGGANCFSLGPPRAKARKKAQRSFCCGSCCSSCPSAELRRAAVEGAERSKAGGAGYCGASLKARQQPSTTGKHMQIKTTRLAGGLLWPYKGLLPAAPKDAGFHCVQAQCPCRLGYPLKGS